MTFNLPPVNSNNNKSSARQGTRMLTIHPSLTNLDEPYQMQPLNNSFNSKVAPRSIKLPSLNLDDRFSMEPTNKISLQSFGVPQGNAAYLPINSNKIFKQNTSYDLLPPNMYLVPYQNPTPKNISFSEGTSPVSNGLNVFMKPMVQPKNFTAFATPLPQMLQNVHRGYKKNYSLLPSTSNRSFEQEFEKRLDQQHRLLSQLMTKLGAEVEEDEDPKPVLNKRVKEKTRPNLQIQSPRNTKNTQYQRSNQQRILRIDEKAESEENSPEVKAGSMSNKHKLRELRLKNIKNQDEESALNSLDDALGLDNEDHFFEESSDLRRRVLKGSDERSSKKSAKSLNDLEMNFSSNPSQKLRSMKSKQNIMGDDDYYPVRTRRGRRDLAQSRLRVIGWTLVYNSLLYDNVKQKVLDEREVFLRTISENLASVHSLLESFILQVAGKQIEEMITNKSHSFLFQSDKLLPAKKIDKECEALYTYCKNILDKLFTFTKTLPDHLFALLATIIEEGSYLPHDYFTEFELRRQQFSYFGKLKFVTAAKSKLLLGGLIIRVLVHHVIMKPWNVFKMPMEKFNPEKLLNIGSLFYNVMMDVLKGLVPIFHNNQSFLSVDLKTKPKKRLAQALDLGDSELKLVIEKDPSRENEIIEGFYSKNQLGWFFTDRKKYDSIEDLKSLFYGWLDCLYESTHQEALKNK